MRFLAVVLAACAALPAQAATISFTGTFDSDDDLELFSFTLGSASTVTMMTLSYAGGVNAAGDLIAPGGFDPILTLFDASGAFLAENDDGTPPDVGVDPVSGGAFDSYFELALGPGSYILALTQFDGFAAGSHLSDGFQPQTFFSCPNGTFCDTAGKNRTSAWAVDILGVDSATSAVPEPSSIMLLGLGLLAVAGGLRRRPRGGSGSPQARA